MTPDWCYLLRQIVPAESVDMVLGEPVVEHQHHGPAAVPAGARLCPGDPTARSNGFLNVLQSSNAGATPHRCKRPIGLFNNHNHVEGSYKGLTWLKAPTSAFTLKTLLRHYAKRALTPRSLHVKLGPQHKSQKGRAGWLA